MSALTRLNAFSIGFTLGLFHMAQGKALLADFSGGPQAWMTASVAAAAALLLGAGLLALARFVFELESRPLNLVALALGVLSLPALFFHSHPTIPFGTGTLSSVWLAASTAAVPLMGIGAIVSGPLRRSLSAPALFCGCAAAVVIFPLALEPSLDFTAHKGIMIAAHLISLVCVAARIFGGAGDPVEETEPPLEATCVACAAIAGSSLCSFAGLVSLNLPILPSIWAPLAAAVLAALMLAAVRPKGCWPERIAIAACSLLLPVLYYETRLLRSIPWLAGLAVSLFLICELCARRMTAAGGSYRIVTLCVLGALLGGLFNLWLAPEIFLSSAELPLALVLLPLVTPGARPAGLRLIDAAPAAIMLAIFVGLLAALQAGPESATASMIAIYAVPGLLAAFSTRPFQAALSLTCLYMLLATVYHLAEEDTIVRRNRFGTIRVFERDSEDLRVLTVGTTVMGYQRREGPERLVPTGIMSGAGPVGDAFGVLYERKPEARVLALGIGAGAVACFPPKDASLLAVEPNRTLLSIVTNDRFFSYVRDCSAKVAPLVGNPAIEPDTFGGARFDMIFVSAFNGLGIPVHFLTRERIAALLGSLEEDGLLAILVADPFVDAEGPLAAAAREEGSPIVVNEIRGSSPVREAVNPPKLFVIAGSGPALAPIASRPGWRTADPRSSAPWTSRHAAIFPHIVY